MALSPSLALAAARLFNSDAAANGVVFDRALAGDSGDVFAAERYVAVARDARTGGYKVLGSYARGGDAARALADAADKSRFASNVSLSYRLAA